MMSPKWPRSIREVRAGVPQPGEGVEPDAAGGLEPEVGGKESQPAEAMDPQPADAEEPQTQSEPSASAGPGPAPDQGIQELAAMAEALLTQAAELRRQSQELAAELATQSEGAGELSDDRPAEPAVTAVDEPAAALEPEPERDPVSGMRIVALNMAAAGRSREEAAQYLKQTFGQEPDPALLDEIFAGYGGGLSSG